MSSHPAAIVYEAKRQGSLEAELRRLSFVPLIVVDEVGYWIRREAVTVPLA